VIAIEDPRDRRHRGAIGELISKRTFLAPKRIDWRIMKLTLALLLFLASALAQPQGFDVALDQAERSAVERHARRDLPPAVRLKRRV
jgi:hypothetical protein